MSDSILKFANKLEIRYSFNNKSNYMDAMTKHRCEKEILTLIRSLADMLDGLEERDLDGGFPLLAQALRKFPPLQRALR